MKSILLSVLAVAMLLAIPASAHHSFTMFDATKQITLVGTVTSFEWTNPHSYIEIDAPGREWRHEALEYRNGQPQHPPAKRLEIQQPEEGR